MYHPSEDSYFLAETLQAYLKKQNKKIKTSKSLDFDSHQNSKKSFEILDLGSGLGIQAETCLKLGFTNILCADIGKESINYLKIKFSKIKSIKIIKSNLFSAVTDKFDLIIFNPPYLPEHKFDKRKDTSGGKHGDETILAFLKQAKSHLTKQGKILLLLSSLTPRKRINQILRQNYKIIKLAEKNIFFENLEIWLITN